MSTVLQSSARPHPDADLLAACADYHAHRAAEERPIGQFASDSLVAVAIENEDVAIREGMKDAFSRAAAFSARTADGIRAKAAVVASALPREIRDFNLALDGPQIRLLLSLTKDVSRVTFLEPDEAPDGIWPGHSLEEKARVVAEAAVRDRARHEAQKLVSNPMTREEAESAIAMAQRFHDSAAAVRKEALERLAELGVSVA